MCYHQNPTLWTRKVIAVDMILKFAISDIKIRYHFSIMILKSDITTQFSSFSITAKIKSSKSTSMSIKKC